MANPRAADDFAAIAARIKELRADPLAITEDEWDQLYRAYCATSRGTPIDFERYRGTCYVSSQPI